MEHFSAEILLFLQNLTISVHYNFGIRWVNKGSQNSFAGGVLWLASYVQDIWLITGVKPRPQSHDAFITVPTLWNL